MGSITKGVGIGIGVVFGVIIAFILIAFFVGLIGTSPEEKQSGYSPIQEMEKITEKVQEAQEEIEKGIEEVEGKEAVNTEDIFKNSKAKNTQKGVTLSIDDYTIEIKGEDFAKITKIKFTILNEGTDTISPYLNIFLWDENDASTDKANSKDSIETDGWVSTGNYKTIEAPVSVAFNDIGLTKILKLTVYDGKYGDLLVSTETTFKAKE